MLRTLRKPSVAFGGKCVLAGLAIAISLPLLTMAPVDAEEPVPTSIVRIEEDWGLLLNEPSQAVDAPQFHTLMSPYGHTDSVYFQTTWNYWELPDFMAGGLQLQAWDGDLCRYDQAFQGQGLSQTAELVRWTQVLETNGEELFVQIENGHSLTWGYFGGDNMKLHAAAKVSNLNGYRPEVSVENSWITYGANRVDGLVLMGVRYYSTDGLVYEDTTNRIIFNYFAGM